MSELSRRDWLRTGPAALSAAMAPAALARADGIVRAPQDFRVLGAPVVQALSATAVSVAWAVNDTSTGWVEYGETEALGSVAAGDEDGLRPLDARVQRVRLDGLTPGTRYHYRTVSVPIAFLGAYDIRRGRPYESRAYSFVTPDGGAAGRMQAAIINDTHEQPETLTRLFTQLAESPGDLLFWNGDMFNDIATEQQLAEQLLYPAGMAYAASRPVCFARGNHDVRGPEARALGRVLDTPSGQHYYTVRQGPVAFLVLDTGEDKPDDAPVYAGLGTFDAYRTRQAAWLAEALQRPEVKGAPFRVVVVHIPLYGATPVRFHGGADARAKWHDHLVRGGVDLMVTGHTHRHAWLPPDATRPFGQLTGGGPQPDAATVIRLDADRQQLTARLSRLDGTLISEHVVTRRA
jgi:predicted phosphodiesterase